MAASRGRRRGAVAAARRSRGNTGWYAIAALVVIAGIALVVMSRGDNARAVPPLAGNPGDHWHSALGVNVCGEWLPNVPEFGGGIHSHGDGLIHTHPFVADDAGRNATVGKFLDHAGYSADVDSFELWDGVEHKTGDKCGDQEAKVRWSLNGEEQTGNIARYHQQDGDVIALALLPEDEEIPNPPQAASLAAPVDLPGGGVTVPPNVSPPDTTADPTATTADPTATTAAEAGTDTTDAPPASPAP